MILSKVLKGLRRSRKSTLADLGVGTSPPMATLLKKIEDWGATRRGPSSANSEKAAGSGKHGGIEFRGQYVHDLAGGRF